MTGEIAPYKPRPRLLKVAAALKAFSLPVLLLPYAWIIVTGIGCNTAIPMIFWFIAMQSTLLDTFAKSFLAKRMLKSGSRQNRILVEMTSAREGCKQVYSDEGVLQIEGGRLVFDGVDSSFAFPIGSSVVESCFDTDGNYSSLKLKVVQDGSFLVTLRQKWNWNEEYRLGDLREEIVSLSRSDSIAEGFAVVPPESNSRLLWPWLIYSGYTAAVIGLMAFGAACIRTVYGLDLPLGFRPTWVVSSIMLVLGVASVALIRREKRVAAHSAKEAIGRHIG